MSERFIGAVRLLRGKRRRLVVEDEAGRRAEIAPRQGMPVFPGDRVKVELQKPVWAKRRRRFEGLREANVIAVVERRASGLIGKYHSSRQHAWVVPKDADVLEPLQVKPRPDIPENTTVAVDLSGGPGAVSGEIAAVWADADSARSQIEQVIYERGLPREFPKAVAKEAERFPGRLSKEDMRGRSDLRNIEVIVIDPADAKDHDDGVSLERRPGGNWRLGVHIADVSHYVRPGSALDGEARARGVSVYLPDRVLPMLPLKLSAGLCSLIAGQDRLARTVFIDYDREGKFLGGEACASVIRPKVNLSYDEAREIIARKGKGGPSVLCEMNRLAGQLRAARFADGSLDFNFPEVDITLDQAGEPEEIRQHANDAANWLIEEFMIAANLFIGTQLSRKGIGIWRVHEPPPMDAIAELEEFLRGLGVKLRRGTRSRDLHPADFQQVLERFRGKPEEYAVHRRVLTSLSLAVYSAENLGHFGLALNDYAHFTSPIRRYADLIVHRLTDPSVEGGRGALYKGRQLASLASQISDLERRAQDAERLCKKKMVLKFLSKRLGETYDGTVSRVERFGAFVELDGLDIDGLLPIEELGRGQFQVSKDRSSMRSWRSGRTVKVGERVKVMVARVDSLQDHLNLTIAG